LGIDAHLTDPRGFAPWTPLHALSPFDAAQGDPEALEGSRAASPARSVRVARLASLARISRGAQFGIRATVFGGAAMGDGGGGLARHGVDVGGEDERAERVLERSGIHLLAERRRRRVRRNAPLAQDQHFAADALHHLELVRAVDDDASAGGETLDEAAD